MKTPQILSFLLTLEKYPIEVMLAKAMIEDGVTSEQELVTLLKEFNVKKGKYTPVISQAMRLKIQNAYGDITRGIYINEYKKIPVIEDFLK